MTQVVPLAKALDEKLFGSKAIGLGQALREGVPVPPGIALSGSESGEATVFIGGKKRSTLKPGDYFGEVALIDQGARMATIVAATGLACYGLTYWDFRPFVDTLRQGE